MYDPNSEPHEFVADDREAAVEKACRFFGVDADALTIAEFPSGEVYGLAGRSVVVAALRGRAARRPERGEEGRGREREERSERPRRGGRERERGGRGNGRRGPRAETRAAEERAPEPPREPSVGTARGELSEVAQFVLGMIERMQLGPFEIAETHEADLRVCQVSGAAAQALTGGDARAADALQLLANQVALRLEDEPARVVVDVEGDAEARESLMTSLAQRVARRARETGRAVALDPMNGRDRRMVHLALRDESDVATMSVGEGRYRQVVVVPEGAPEYEKARREAEEAASRSDA